MFSILSIIIQFSFFLLNSNLTVRCKPNAVEYQHYLIDVLKHVENQPGWSSKEHLYLRHDNDQLSSVEDYLNKPVAPDNYMIKLQMFTRFINCRYTELLFTFNKLLENFLAKSRKLMSNGTTGEIIYCASQIRTVVEQSAYFFEKLSVAISFIDQLDLRIIDSDMDKPDTIVEEIKSYWRFFDWKKTVPSFSEGDVGVYAFHEFESLRRFLENNAKPKVISLMSTVHEVCVFEDNKDFVGVEDVLISGESFLCFSEMLVSYILRIIIKEYEEMGFDRLTNKKSSEYLKPPEILWTSTDAQEFLRKLFTHSGWIKLDYIKVKTFHTLRIIDGTTPINNDNYSSIQIFTSRLIKFRYAELLFYFNCMFTVLINACCDEFNDSSQMPFKTSPFIECAVYAYESMKTSAFMFKSMLTAVQKMRISSRSTQERVQKWPLEIILKLIVDFIENFELNNYAAVDFTETVAYEFLQTFNSFLLNETYGPIKNIMEVNYRYCQTGEWISTEKFLKVLTPSLQRTVPGEPDVLFKKLCIRLNKFYGDVLSEDFTQLGFHQVIF